MRTIFAGIQVRLASSRFPNKAFAKIHSKELILHVIQRVQKINYPLHIVLLCPSAEQNIFSQFLQKSCINIPVFGGAATHVLKRYYDAANYFNSKDLIMRITGDNPLLSITLADLLIQKHLQNECSLSHFIGNPLGTGLEIFSYHSLQTSYKNAISSVEKEHVTKYIYDHPTLFTIYEPESPYKTPTLKHLSVDYPEDIILIESLLKMNPHWDLDNYE